MYKGEFLERAIKLAEDWDGLTLPNPSVGALLVKGDRVLAEGVHRGPGTLHGEALAIKRAMMRYGKDALKGAQLYVSLEPCSSWGRTPPCTDAIISSGIKKVVVGSWDPNPVHHKRSRLLRNYGIELVKPRLSRELKTRLDRLYWPFRVFVTQRRPFIICKIAQTIDGRIADSTGSSKWITSKRMRQYVHNRLRFRSDGLITGVNTVLKDNPRLTLRATPSLMRRRKRPFYRVVLDSRLRLSPDMNVFKSATKDAPLFIFTSQKVSVSKIQTLLSKAGRKAEFLSIVRVSSDRYGLNLFEILDVLAKQGISRLVLESGPTLVGSFIRQGLVDRLLVCLSNSIIGSGEPGIYLEGSLLSDRRWLSLDLLERVGEELWMEFSFVSKG